MAASLPLQHGNYRPWVHAMDAEVILHLLRHADRERTTGIPAGEDKALTQLPLKWLRVGLSLRGRHDEHPFRWARATSHHSDALLHKTDWAAYKEAVLQNTPPDPSHLKLIVAGDNGHLELRRHTMPTLGAVATRAQHSHALTHRRHTPLGTAHVSAYIHARDLTAAATNAPPLRAREGHIPSHTPVQRRLDIRKEPLSGVSVLPRPCPLCGGKKESPLHVHMGCT